MSIQHSVAHRLLALSLLVIIGIFPGKGAASQQIVDQVLSDMSGASPKMRILFNIPLRYASHSPVQRGTELQVLLRLVNTTDTTLSSPGTEQPTWSNELRHWLSDIQITYHSVNQPVLLRIQFRRDVDFTVHMTSDFRALELTLNSESTSMPSLEKTPVIRSEPRLPAPAKHTESGSIGADDAAMPRTSINFDYLYAINLESQLYPIDIPALPRSELFRTYPPYTVRFVKEGKVWYRLRIGFFKDGATASTVLESAKQMYPEAWIARTSESERTQAKNQLKKAGLEAETQRQPIEPATDKLFPPLGRERLSALTEEGRQAMANGDYGRAIQIYTRLSLTEGNPNIADAVELLGVARERNGQLAQAKAQYELYLSRYPDGEGADRVRQRLAGLVTARKPPRERLRTAKSRARDEEVELDVFGGFSQFYRRDWSVIDDEDETVDQSLLSSDLDLTVRRRSGSSDIRARFTGGYDHDFLESNSSESRVSSLYLDIADIRRDLSARLGRQTRNTGGVLGRFDGGLIGYQVTPQIRMDLVAGFPVDSTSDSVDTDRRFLGIGSKFGTYAKHWDFLPYAIHQSIDSEIDRQAVGLETRYFDGRLNILNLTDYDVYFNKLNTFLVLGNWFVTDGLSTNFTFDWRRSPILTTRNALQGQTVDTIDDLKDSFSSSEIKQLALDRTAISRSVTAGVSKTLNDQFQLTGDVTVSNLSSTTTSGGVDKVPGTGNEYFYSIQLIGSGLIKSRDSAILGLRYSDTSTSDTISASVNTRYPVNSMWRINPRIRIDYRQNKDGNGDLWRFAPSLKTDYLIRRLARLEAEIGAEFTTDDLSDETEERNAYFIFVGYRLDF